MSILPQMTTRLNKQIISLRKKGLTYNQIANKLNCSKSTVSYALRKKTRLKVKEKTNKIPKHEISHRKKIYRFKNPKTFPPPKRPWYLSPSPRQISKAITGKAHTFQQPMTFNYKDVYAKYGDHFPCALTGRPLDFNKPETYEYDHIIPTSRGGDNTIDNLQIVCPEANRAKQNLTDEEFLDLCKEVVLNKGYKLYKPLDK